MSDFPQVVQLLPSSDRYTYYIKNYVGKNLANVGYTSLGGTRNDRYGAAYVQFVLVTDDGSYVDPSDENQLKKYVVIKQDVAPNSVMKLVYLKDSKDNEYSNLVDSQTYERITLYLEKK